MPTSVIYNGQFRPVSELAVMRIFPHPQAENSISENQSLPRDISGPVRQPEEIRSNLL
jgi:hypothetical protein